jgi:hypothetical protein
MSPLRHLRVLCALVLFAFALAFAASNAVAGPYTKPGTPPPVKIGPKPSSPWMTPAAVELITDGGFEAGGLGWSVINNGNGQWFVLTGTTAPISLFTIPAPPEGTFQAVVDQGGPGSHILYQDVTIPAGSTATLNFILWYSNQATGFANPPSLDPNVIPNQQFRVDILDPNAAPDDMGAGILQSVFVTVVNSPNVISYTPISANLDAFAGQTIRLRFAEVDNQFFFTVGVDAVSIQAEPIVPATVASWGSLKSLYHEP